MATYTVSTKQDKDSVAKVTKLTVDFANVERDTLEQIALSAIIIKWQAQVRKSGIPETDTIDANDYKPGTRIAPTAKVETLISKMSPAEKAALIEKLMSEV